MSTSTPPDNTVLKLNLPSPRVRTEPVEGAVIGMPMAAFDASEIVDSAAVTIYPPSAGTVNKGDIMELWLKDEKEALDTKPVIDPNAIITAHIHKSRMHADRENWLFYTFRREGNNLGTSPSLSILYNRIRPGLKDRYDSPGGHSELKLFLPDEIKNGVGPDFVSAEVCVAYPYCRAYDEITFECNGESLKSMVDANQAPPPPNPGDETPITICFTITRAYLDKAKRQDKKLHFSYTVTDQLGNGPDRDATWSPVQTVAEDLDGELLPKPILLERKGDYPGDDASCIDLEKLAGEPLLVVVPTGDIRFAGRDLVVATYTASKKELPEDVMHTVEGNVVADEFGSKDTLYLQVPYEKIIPGSEVTVIYEQQRPVGNPIGTSVTARATVSESAPIDLKPEITSVTDSQNADIPHEGGTVDRKVTLTGTATPGQQVEIFEGAASRGKRPVDGTGTWTYTATLSGIGTRTFTAKADYGSGQVSDGRTFTLSNAHTPAITLVQDSHGQEIPDATSTVDTTIKLTGTATPRLEVEVFNNGTSVGTAKVRATDGKWELEVKGLSRTTHRFKAKALYTPGAESAVRTVTVSEDAVPTIESVKGSPSGVDIPPDGATTETAVTLTGTASKGLNVEIFDGVNTSGPAAVDPETGIWMRTVNDLDLGEHEFTAKALYGAEHLSHPRRFEVVPEFDDLTTFTDSDWNGWTNRNVYHPISIVSSGGEYYAVSSPGSDGGQRGFTIIKTFSKLEAGATYTFSFDYKCASPVRFEARGHTPIFQLPASNQWENYAATFIMQENVPNSPLPQFYIVISGHPSSVSLDNLRLRKNS